MPFFGNDKSRGKTRKSASNGVSKVATPVRRRARRREHWTPYVKRVLKHVAPDNGLSADSAMVMSSFVEDMLDKLVRQAVQLMQKADRSTLTDTDMENAVAIVVPGDLSRSATEEGVRAVTAFTES